jgi:phage terminase small subunit
VGRPRDIDRLNPQEARFVAAYLREPNATRAAIAAGYSAASAASQGSRLLKRGKVARALGVKVAKVVQEAESTAVEVVQELRRVGTSDPADLVDPTTGCVLPLHEMPLHARRAIASMEVEELRGEDGQLRGRLVKVKLWPKVDANRVLAQKHGLLVEKHELELGQKTLAAVLAAARARKGTAA